MTAVIIYTALIVFSYAFSLPKLWRARPEPVFTEGTTGHLLLGTLILTVPALWFLVASVGWTVGTIAAVLWAAFGLGRGVYQTSEYGGIANYFWPSVGFAGVNLVIIILLFMGA